MQPTGLTYGCPASQKLTFREAATISNRSGLSMTASPRSVPPCASAPSRIHAMLQPAMSAASPAVTASPANGFSQMKSSYNETKSLGKMRPVFFEHERTRLYYFIKSTSFTQTIPTSGTPTHNIPYLQKHSGDKQFKGQHATTVKRSESCSCGIPRHRDNRKYHQKLLKYLKFNVYLHIKNNKIINRQPVHIKHVDSQDEKRPETTKKNTNLKIKAKDKQKSLNPSPHFYRERSRIRLSPKH